ncbi:MAG: hypothetical protein IT204_11555 [Fimbriimonadaceae bacterium]|nr:hypothetical protein [Fimbriimonadaceae bacterium]
MIARLLPLLLACPTLLAAPTVAAGRAADLRLDGQLNEPAWATVPWSSGFSRAGRDEQVAPAAVQTRFKVLVEDAAVTVGIVCDEPQMASLKAATPWRDGAIWQDDCVEVFCDPANEGRYYHQVMVNSRGAIYDSHSADYGLVHSRLWNGAFEAAGAVDPAAGQWSVELRLPYAALLLPAQAGATWRFNVARERQAGGKSELTSWAPLQGNFHQPRLWGTLTGLPADYRGFRYRLGEPAVEVNSAANGWSTLHLSWPLRNETTAASTLTPSLEVIDQPATRQAGPAVEVPVGREVALQLPPLKVQAAANAWLVLRLTDAAGRLVVAQVKSLSSQARPLQVTLRRPCYRGNIYASEKLPALAYDLQLSAAVRQSSAAVVAQLTDPAGRVLRQQRLAIGELAAAQQLPLPELAVGRYTLTVQALAADGAVQATQAVPIRKLPAPPAGHEVRIDEQRNLLVDGRPVLPIGWYGGLPTADPRPEVLALQNVTTPEVVGPGQTAGIAEAYRQSGRYTVISLENGRLYYAFNLWRQGQEELAKTRDELHTLTAPSEDLKRLARELVESVRGTPGLLGYYLADEPEIHDIPSSYLESYYQFLAELDPYHPVFITNDTIDGLVTHGVNCADVLDPDPYSPDWDYVPNFLKKINEIAGPGKATWVTLWHSTGDTHFAQEWGSGPAYSYRVCRNQYLASVAYGAKGFTAYTSAFFLPEIEYRYGLPPIWRELRLLEPAIAAPAGGAVTVDGAPELARWARRAKGHVYLIVVNHKPGEARGTVHWDGLAGVTSLTVMSEGRQVAVRDGAFSDTWAEGDAHVYTTDPAAAALPTTAAVTAELAQRKAAAAKPGNLLHVSRGVRARASEGFYAPWFEQYYYYAINGLTDDAGWSASHAGGKPSWLELALPAEGPVGQVVIHTPNLADYRVDLTTADGRQASFSVVGNTQTTIVHDLRPAVSCLKLRLTAAKARNGVPTVAEIEAYAAPGSGPATVLTQSAPLGVAKVAPRFSGAGGADLWDLSFAPLETAPQFYWDARDTRWVLDPAKLQATAVAGGGVRICSTAPEGYAAMSRILPLGREQRFFQVDLQAIAGEGYRYAHLGVTTSSGQPGYRMPLNINRPGLYTLDLHHVHDNYRQGRDQNALVRLGCAGSAQQADGTVRPGPCFQFGWVRLVARPRNALVVTRADGSPLGETLRAGDTLHFEVLLDQPARDVVVEAQAGSALSSLRLNGEPYVPLRPADDTQRVWVGQLTLGPGSGTFRYEGYPLVFRAVVTGGSIPATYAAVSSSLE